MKKRIAVEIETSEDGKYCGSECEKLIYNKRIIGRKAVTSPLCTLFREFLGLEQAKRCHACIKAECKAAREVGT